MAWADDPAFRDVVSTALRQCLNASDFGHQISDHILGAMTTAVLNLAENYEPSEPPVEPPPEEPGVETLDAPKSKKGK